MLSKRNRLTYSGEGYEDEVDAVQEGPARLQRPEDQRGHEEREDEQECAQHSQVHQSDLGYADKNRFRM